MAISDETLRSAGVRVSHDQLDHMVLAVLAQMPRIPTDAAPAAELTPADVAALQRGGFSLDAITEGGQDDPVARVVATHAALLASSLSVGEAGRLLGVNDSRVRQRLAARTLYGIKTSDAWRLPSFQFDRSRPLPGIDKVLPRLDPDLHPTAVYSWFTEPDPDLIVDGRAVSPRDWLRAGHDPAEVATIAADL